MNILVTAGATEVPIDSVRAITNIFRGRTGTEIAIRFAVQSAKLGEWPEASPHRVTLLTSNPRLAEDLKPKVRTPEDPDSFTGPPWNLDSCSFRTFDELAATMEREVRQGCQRNFRPERVPYDLVIHSAAVSDYRVRQMLTRGATGALVPVDASGKIRSDHDQLFLELERTPKLVEKIKNAWGFTGKLVQFKLEVGISDDELIRHAQAALARSHGDLVVANCLEWMRERAILVGADGTVEEVKRPDLPRALIERF